MTACIPGREMSSCIPKSEMPKAGHAKAPQAHPNAFGAALLPQALLPTPMGPPTATKTGARAPPPTTPIAQAQSVHHTQAQRCTRNTQQLRQDWGRQWHAPRRGQALIRALIET